MAKKQAAKPKPAKPKVVRVKAFAAFDKYHNVLPHSIERDPSVFSEWVLRNLTVRPIVIEYAVSE